MKPFEPATQELRTGGGLVKRSTFLRILRRIAELSGVQLAPLSRASETGTGASYKLSVEASRKQWGVTINEDGNAAVGPGCVMIEGRGGYQILSTDSLTIGETGYIGISATVRFDIGPPTVDAEIRSEWRGWVTVTVAPSLKFKTEPPSSKVTVNYATRASTATELFLPLAYIEGDTATDLIRDGVTIRLADQGAFPQPLFIFALT